MKSIGSIENLISFFRMYSISLALCCLKVAVWLCWSTLFKHESWSVLFILLYLNAGGHLWAVCVCFISLQEGWKKGNRHSCNTVGGNDTFGLSHLFSEQLRQAKGCQCSLQVFWWGAWKSIEGCRKLHSEKSKKHGLLVIFWAHFWRHHRKAVGNQHIWTVPKISFDFYAQRIVGWINLLVSGKVHRRLKCISSFWGWKFCLDNKSLFGCSRCSKTKLWAFIILQFVSDLSERAEKCSDL